MVADGGPGLFGLQLSVPDFTYTIGSMLVSANQDVRVFATAPRVSVTFEGDLSVNGEDARLTVRGSIVELLFGGGTEVTGGGGLFVQGDIGYLAFPGGLHVGSGSGAEVTSDSDRSIRMALGTPWFAIDPTYNEGSFYLYRVALLNTDRQVFGVVEGTLPGSLSVELDANHPGGTGIAQSGTVARGLDGSVGIPPELNSAIGQVFTDANIDDFVAAVNSGATGLIGLRSARTGRR
eukprot:COSAG02_NODE_10548_length_1916_cov_3.674188_1_plen_234_part_10